MTRVPFQRWHTTLMMLMMTTTYSKSNEISLAHTCDVRTHMILRRCSLLSSYWHHTQTFWCKWHRFSILYTIYDQLFVGARNRSEWINSNVLIERNVFSVFRTHRRLFTSFKERRTKPRSLIWQKLFLSTLSIMIHPEAKIIKIFPLEKEKWTNHCNGDGSLKTLFYLFAYNWFLTQQSSEEIK